jgi:uncharacterized repeat protein (TIGR03843 family)
LDVALDLLAHRELSIEGRLPWSSNLTFLVSLEDTVDPDTGYPDTGEPTTGEPTDGRPGQGDDDGTVDRPEPVQAVYKPHRGEQSLWDFPDGLYRREVAAYELSEALGWGIVPPTVLRDDAPFGSGSVQLFIAADYERHYFTLLEDGALGEGDSEGGSAGDAGYAGDAGDAADGSHADVLRTFCAFDVVANNADRKSGHVLVDAGERLWGIDHGLCFHAQHKLRTVIWDFAGEEVPAHLVDDLVRLVSDGLPEALEELLSGAEAEALLHRAARLAGEGIFPEPTGDRPPYPWPLV